MMILVTGGAGFLGRHFIAHHVAAGDEVVAVDSLVGGYSHWWEPEGHSDVEDLPYAWYERDLEWFLKKGVAEDTDWDVVYHFAAPVGGRVKIEGDPLYNADSLRLDAAVFRWATGREGRVKTLVYPSSSAVYPISMQGEKRHQLQEGMFSARNPNWFKPDEMYGFTKLVGEMLALSAEKYGLNTLCIRPFSGYGEDQPLEYPIPAIAQRALRREDPLTIWGSGQQMRDFIHVDDVVGATVARVAAGVHGYEMMNICSGFPISFIAIARTLSQLVHDESYSPRIVTDESKPQGVTTRYGDPQRMRKYYDQPLIAVGPGLKRVLDYLAIHAP